MAGVRHSSASVRTTSSPVEGLGKQSSPPTRKHWQAPPRRVAGAQEQDGGRGAAGGRRETGAPPVGAGERARPGLTVPERPRPPAAAAAGGRSRPAVSPPRRGPV